MMTSTHPRGVERRLTFLGGPQAQRPRKPLHGLAGSPLGLIKSTVMEEVEAFFNTLGLGEHVPACEQNGYDHMGCILEHDDEDLDILAAHVGMLPGHLFLLKEAVRHLHNVRNRAQTGGAPTVFRVPIIQLNGPGGPVAAAAGAAAAGAAASTTVPVAVAAATATETLPTKRKAQDHVLPQFCKTTEEVKVESRRHSTALGFSAMRDNKSSSRKIMFRCRSVLSKRLRKEMGPAVAGAEQFTCPHCLVWNFTKKIGGGGYKLNQAQSVLEHAPHCVATQKVTRAELKHDAAFVKHAINNLDSTGKQAAKTAVGRGGRLDGSVKSRTAKRASNDLKRYHDKDYEEDWSKIRPWGAEYERLNRAPGMSRFDMKVDDQNRSVIKPMGP